MTDVSMVTSPSRSTPDQPGEHPSLRSGVEIVSSSPARGAGLRGAVDEPTPGATFAVYGFRATGWALADEARVESIEVRSGGEVIGWSRIDRPRPDIAALHPGNPHSRRCGFVVDCGTVGLPRSFEAAVMVVLEDGSRITLGTLTGLSQPIQVSFAPSLQPLMITSLGRTGTTWLMRLLLEHPSVVVHPAYPYEARLAAYWMQMLKVTVGPANHRDSSHPDSFNYDPYRIGKNPFFRASPLEPARLHGWLGRDYVEHMCRFCQESVELAYRSVAEETGRRAATCFAEKGNPGPIPRLIAELYPEGHEIFLVRDFRDMVASILAFNEKRGYAAFGRDEVRNDVDYVARLAASARRLHEDWVCRSDEALLLRYEDLIADPAGSLSSVFAHAGLDDSASVVEGVVARGGVDDAALERHRTAASPASSIGRWRSDLGPAVQEACADNFSDLLDAFGYDP